MFVRYSSISSTICRWYINAVSFHDLSFSFLALGNLGNILTQKGKLDEAEYVFQKALEFRPNMADVYYNL